MKQLPRHDFRGFTLVELLVTLGLVVILMSGVAYVFSAVSKSASVGQVISEQVRDIRSVQGAMEQDFRSIVPSKEGTPLVIRNVYQPGFSSRDDLNSDRDFRTTANYANINSRDVGTTFDSLSPGAYTYDFRNHRLDTVSFFARNYFPRQTGNDGIFVSGNSSSEAYVNYGHLVLPDNSGLFQSSSVDLTPGSFDSGLNPNNYFANQWILGRNITLLKAPSTATATLGAITYAAANELHYPRPGTASVNSLAPLGIGTAAAFTPTGAVPTPVRYNYDSRVDLAGTTIDSFMAILRNSITAAGPTPAANQRWWGRYDGTASDVNALMGIDRRYRATPFLVPPVTSRKAAEQVPMFLPGCTQFVVEYAGDFLAQSNSGAITGSVLTGVTDGVIDWADYDPDGSGPSANTRQIRWYGLPRDTGGATGAGGVPIIAQPATAGVANCDVVPLRDVTGGIASFERVVPPYFANYYGVAVAAAGSAAYLNQQYVCAWGPSEAFRPKLIRVVMTVDDRNGSSNPPQSQSFEFVFEVP